MVERNTRIRAGQISSVRPNDLEATNATSDGYVAKYDSATGKFTWVYVTAANTNQSFTNGDLSSGILTVTHNLGNKYCLVQIYDNNDKKINPDEITLVDTDSLSVDLSSFGTLSGTWHVVIMN